MTPIMFLVVDDRPEDVTALEWGLEDIGKFSPGDFVLRSANDSDGALEVVAEEKPSILIMDVNLQGSPIPNGLDLIPVIKQAVGNGFKVLVLTTSPAPSDVQKAIDNGALAVMEKLTGDPFADTLNTMWEVFVNDNYCPRNLASGPGAHFLWISDDFVEPAE